MSGSGPPARSARTATVVVAVLVLALLAVLVGLVGSGGSDAVPPASSASVRTPTTGRSTPATSTRRPTTRTTSPSTPQTTTDAGGRDPGSGLRLLALSALPREAQETVGLIDAGGPFPYAKDGVTFRNSERVLPGHPRGWYREYTVRTPGEGDRGPRRIVTGDDGRQLFYTADHYVSFVRVTR